MNQPIAHPNFWPRLWLGVAVWCIEHVSRGTDHSIGYELHVDGILTEIDEFRETYYPAVEITKYP